MIELDRIDRKILDILQAEGRISNTELAQRVGLSMSPCSERVRRLERNGVITGYHARLDPEALGQPLLVFVEITLSSKSADVFDKVRNELMLMPEVQECHLVSGSFDYLVKARLAGMDEYRNLLGAMLKKLPVPAQSQSYVVMESVKEGVALRTGGAAPVARRR
ncbi:winged helix-turn-helix transcriptional regulator [Variovorax dokdonensis]|uniref:Winged helix-turn-helix transcriptional regulator n=1 Tax=Variovorax dokdonensis TaxID=344883 RepID=A0ABT7N8A3_9BURK|nr:winged helix-turn-helix transcriptional regulator [Variovorax dokdonensis]MDM0044157.1 winged helix-turn-helix transcriptional regulator [Variovorax dokdonensis]